MKYFAGIAVPLSKQLNNRTSEDTKLVWHEDMPQALNQIKELLLQNVVLYIPEPYKAYVLEVESSDYAVGDVRSQHNSAGEQRLVSFFSRQLQGKSAKVQLKWSIRDKETDAIVGSLAKLLILDCKQSHSDYGFD